MKSTDPNPRPLTEHQAVGQVLNDEIRRLRRLLGEATNIAADEHRRNMMPSPGGDGLGAHDIGRCSTCTRLAMMAGETVKR